jgi:hypothetical protein
VVRPATPSPCRTVRGSTVETTDAGVAHAERIWFGGVVQWGVGAVVDLPVELVHIGTSLGAASWSRQDIAWRQRPALALAVASCSSAATTTSRAAPTSSSANSSAAAPVGDACAVLTPARAATVVPDPVQAGRGAGHDGDPSEYCGYHARDRTPESTPFLHLVARTDPAAAADVTADAASDAARNRADRNPDNSSTPVAGAVGDGGFLVKGIERTLYWSQGSGYVRLTTGSVGTVYTTQSDHALTAVARQVAGA